MAIAGNFDDKSDAGFVRAYDARTARRQFQISSILVLVPTQAAFALGILSQLTPPIAASGLRPPDRTALTSRKRYWTFAANVTNYRILSPLVLGGPKSKGSRFVQVRPFFWARRRKNNARSNFRRGTNG